MSCYDNCTDRYLLNWRHLIAALWDFRPIPKIVGEFKGAGPRARLSKYTNQLSRNILEIGRVLMPYRRYVPQVSGVLATLQLIRLGGASVTRVLGYLAIGQVVYEIAVRSFCSQFCCAMEGMPVWYMSF